MAWIDQLKGNPLDWLLEPSTPEVRYVAMRDLVEPAVPAVELAAARQAAHRKGNIAAVLDGMEASGFWMKPGAGYNPKYCSTVWAVILLAQLGASLEEDDRIGTACSYVLDHAFADGGQFSINGAPSGTIDCLQGNLCWAVNELGWVDPRLEKAYEWMARSVTGEGIAPRTELKATIRYYSGKCGPCFACGANFNLPCAWGGAKVMLALSGVNRENRTPLMERAIQTGVDFFFSVDPAEAAYPFGMGKAPSRNWWKFGFPVFYVTDLLQVVQVLVDLGYSSDPRLQRALALIRDKQDDQGRWMLEYDYTGKTWGDYGEKKKPNKWVTLRALRVLKRAGNGD